MRLIGLGGTGVVNHVRGSRALVHSGDKRLWVDVAQLEHARRPAEARPRATVRVEADSGPDRELNLLGHDREAARERLERYLDQAWTAGLGAVRVVHGHGTGTLRKMVTEVCKTHPAVRSFTHPPQNRGGTGVTEIELESGT